MKQAEDHATVDWIGGHHAARGRKPGQRVGPYGTRYDKPENARARARKSTGLTMPEFAKAAGISERTLRNWEGGVGKPSIGVLAAISDALRKHKADAQLVAGAFPTSPGCKLPNARAPGAKESGSASLASVNRAAVERAHAARQAKAIRVCKFADPMTGDTWTGRGLMPRWLKARMEQGRKLSEFITGSRMLESCD